MARLSSSRICSAVTTFTCCSPPYTPLVTRPSTRIARSCLFRPCYGPVRQPIAQIEFVTVTIEGDQCQWEIVSGRKPLSPDGGRQIPPPLDLRRQRQEEFINETGADHLVVQGAAALTEQIPDAEFPAQMLHRPGEVHTPLPYLQYVCHRP